MEAYLASPCDASYRDFAASYEAILAARFDADRRPYDALAELASQQDVYLGCSCPTRKNPLERCHTLLALRFMQRRYPDLTVQMPPAATGAI